MSFDHRPHVIYPPADDLFCAAFISPILLLHSTRHDTRLECYSSRDTFLITTIFAHSPRARHTSNLSIKSSHIRLATCYSRQLLFSVKSLMKNAYYACHRKKFARTSGHECQNWTGTLCNISLDYSHMD
jgi:hypothetical protein